MIYHNFIRVLYIDMKTAKIKIEERHDLMKYLGGVGVAARLLEENIKPELEPLHPDQPVVFAIGALTYVFPVMTKTVAMFVSPLTGELGESYAGGRMGTMMFMAGFDAIVITGKSDIPRMLSISPYDTLLRDARSLWGTDSDQNIGRILREREPGAGKRSIIRIGVAGENLVSFASVSVDRYRHFGRLGLGAVLGSKNIKAITISGGRNIDIKNHKEYIKAYRDIYKKCAATDAMQKYHDVGTPINILSLNAAGGLPTHNLQDVRFDKAEHVSGEAFSEKNLVRKMACTGCPVGCIHIGQFRRQFADHGYEYEAISVGYDYELIYALGTFLGVGDTDAILELIEEVEVAGMDAMSAGVALGWATEAFANGLVSEAETLVKLEFGYKDGYVKALQNLANGVNEFYKTLGQGVRFAAQMYGGEDFAMQVAGNEMAGYHTGYGSLIGAAVGARHSHLCNGGYAVDQSQKDFDEDKVLDKLEAEEIERCMLNSLVMCLFARKAYDRETVLKALAAIDQPMTDAELDAVALRNYRTKLRIKRALGFSLDDVKLPKRYFETPSLNGMLDEDTAYRMLEKYRDRIGKLLAEDEDGADDAD